MRSPSSRCLINQVDVYPAIDGQDKDGAPQFTYANTPKYQSVPCTVQVGEYEEIVEESTSLGDAGQQRLTRLLHYRIMFGSYVSGLSRAKITWIDNNRVLHILITQAGRDEAGRGAAFTVKAVERL